MYNLRPSTLTPHGQTTINAADRLWQLYGDMKRLCAVATVARGGEGGSDYAALATQFGFSSETQAQEFYELLIAASAYVQADYLADGVTPNPLKVLIHKLG